MKLTSNGVGQLSTLCSMTNEILIARGRKNSEPARAI